MTSLFCLRSSFRKCTSVFSASLVLAGTVSSISRHAAFAAGETSIQADSSLKPIDVFEFRDPTTQELIRFQYQPTPKSELRKIKPSQMRKIQTQGIPPKGTAMGAVKNLAMDFPAEYAAFTLAMAFSTQIHASNTPTYAQDFIDQNASVAGVASFAGFIAASRASHAVLQSFGLAYDPRRAGLDYRVHTPFRPGSSIPINILDANGNTVPRGVVDIPGRNAWENSRVLAQPQPPTRFQRNFAPLLGPIGLSAGMIVSSAMHELMADPNLRICAKGTYLPGQTSEKDKAETQAKVDAACDQFWEDFALSKKAADYTPDVLAMASASLIDAYIVKKGIIGGTKLATKKAFGKAVEKSGVVLGQSVVTGGLEARAIRAGSERYIPWVLRGLRTGAYIGSIGTGPVGKFAMTVGNIFIFMEIVHPITPLIKKPFERSRQGNDVTKRINEVLFEIDRTEKNKWSWVPRPDSDFCGSDIGYQTDANGTPIPYATCVFPEQPSPDFLLKKMAERQAKWREFILQDAYLSHTSWQSYVAQFATMYANASAFYEQVVSHINFQRFDARAKNDPSYLFQADAFNGLYTDPEKRDSDSARAAITQAREWLETYLEGQQLKARNSKFRVHPTERDSLPKILTGLRALDANVSLLSLGAVEASFRNTSAMTPVQKREFEARARERLLAEAIKELRRVLSTDVVYSDAKIPVNSPRYRHQAERNPFMALRLRLGDPRPLGIGQGFINAANDDETIIGQDFKKNHPSGIGRALANSMTEYLMLSMVCGPEIDPRYSSAQKVKIYRQRNLSMFERALAMFGLGGKPVDANDNGVLIAVNEHIKETTGKDRSGLVPKFKEGAIITEWAGYQAEFRPPRIVEGISPEICRWFADNSKRDSSMYDPFTAEWTIGGVRYNGIIDIVTQKARAEIVGSALPPAKVSNDWQSPFEIWWSEKVDKHVVEAVARFRADYRQVLKEKYIPALTKTGVDGVKIYNGRPFKLGAFEALYDEATLYMLILGKTSKVTEDAATRKSFDTLSTSVLLEFKNVASVITDLEFVEQKGAIASAAYELKRKELETRLGELQAFVEARQGKTKATPDVLKINQQAMKNMTGLLGEMDSYWGVIRGIQVEGL